VITHVVSFRWKPETTPEQIAAIEAELTVLPSLVPSIKTYSFGRDLQASAADNMDFVVVATFDSVDDWREYDQHPEHNRVRVETIRPQIAERAAVQFQS
jgi:stress responsive alpha/beta barrel protein